MSSELRRIVVRALALPFALAILVATLTSTEIFYLRRLASAVDHTRIVLFTASRALRLVIDQETGIRGYLLTGAPEFLEPYTLGADQVSRTLADLRHQVRENPTEASRLTALNQAVSAWQSAARGWIAIASTDAEGRARASQLTALRLEKARMDNIRDRL